MAEDTLSEKLSRRNIDLRLDDVPPGAVEGAKLHILDSLGCLLAGSCLEPGELAYRLAVASSDNSSSSTSTLLGTLSRVSFLDAVQAMAVVEHCGEMDDMIRGGGTGIVGMIVSGVVALG